MEQKDRNELEVENQDTIVNDQESGGQGTTHEMDTETALRNELQELKDKYLRQVAEFDNFRKRTAREKVELIQTAGKDVIVSLLDVIDDCDRAEKQLLASGETSVAQEGVLLVFNKLRNILQSKGLKPMQSIGTPFNPDQHEAITEIPVPDAELKGKVIDELEKGYYLNDKIIRFAKVVVGK